MQEQAVADLSATCDPVTGIRGNLFEEIEKISDPCESSPSMKSPKTSTESQGSKVRQSYGKTMSEIVVIHEDFKGIVEEMNKFRTESYDKL